METRKRGLRPPNKGDKKKHGMVVKSSNAKKWEETRNSD